MKTSRFIAAAAIVGAFACTSYSVDASLDETGGGDDGSACNIQCTTYPFAGCCEGYNCVSLSSSGAANLSCVRPTGSVPLNGRCTNTLDCVPGFECAKPSSSGVGLCLPYASSDPASCDGTLTGGTGGVPPACEAPCAPWDMSSCGTLGAGCYFLSATKTVCAAAGTGQGASACPNNHPYECAAGYGCNNGDCRKMCRNDADCASGKTCQQYPAGPNYNGTPVGFCLL